MIDQTTFDTLKEKAATFRYSSFEWLEYESVADYAVLEDSPERIVLRGRKKLTEINELQWAADEPDSVIRTAKAQGVETLVTFVPEEWKARFLDAGFSEYGMLREYWVCPLKNAYTPKTVCMPIAPDECAEAASVTQSCRMQSREFYGESEESVRAWISGNDPDAQAGGARHEAVLAFRLNGAIAGVVCTAVYGYESMKGPIAWIREVAVRPEYQGRGVGCALIESALQYGIERGAVCSFLMADDCNAGAIALYKKIGFEPNDELQIDLCFAPLKN